MVIGTGGRAMATAVARMLRLSVPLLADPDREAFLSFGFDRAFAVIQKSGTVLVDSRGVIRYSLSARNPIETFDLAGLMREVEKLPRPDGSDGRQ